MSTSSEFTWAGADPPIHSFEYPAAKAGMPLRFDPAGLTGTAVEPAHRLVDLQKQLQQARQEGQREGELRARTIFEEALRVERETLRQSLIDFERERKSYFRRVETEVVQLSLAIARKVLHREAQVDKSLLAAIVRVSIEQLAESTGVVVRVHGSEEQEWIRYFANSDLTPQPQIIADASLAADCCVVSTQLGTTEIGIESQLKEIEKGLFDLLSQRPGA